MKTQAILAVTLVLSAALVESVAAEPGPRWRGGGGWGPNAPYGRLYDPKTVETFTGEVIAVEIVSPIKQMSGGVHLKVKTDREIVSVHLGPAWYIENQDTKIEPRDKIEVKGSRVTIDGKPAVIAAEVRKGDEVLKLRDENGIPIWAGWRKR